MQPLTSESEVDPTPPAALLPPLYLNSARIRRIYESLRDDTIPLTPPSSTATTPTPSPPPSPVHEPQLDPPDVPNTCDIEVAPPSDEQLGLPSAVNAALDDVPDAIKPLVLALWKAPDVAVLHGYSRSQAATALAHALNLHRAAGAARAVLVVPRIASAAKVWQQQLSASLDEVKVTTLRSVRAPRTTCLNSLRMEQYPGVVILADKSLKDPSCWNEVRQALRENRVVNAWDIVISEIRGGDSTLNLYHSPFRLVSDKQARSGMFVMCSDDVARVHKEQFSKHAVRDFVQTQLPSLSSLSEESIWITPASIGNSASAAKKPTTPKPKSKWKQNQKAKSQQLEDLRRKADAFVSELKNTPPTYRQIPSRLSDGEFVRSPEVDHTPQLMTRAKRVPRSLSVPMNTSRTQKRAAAGRVPLQENRKPTIVKGEPQRRDGFQEIRRASPSQDVSTMRSNVSRTRRRSSLQDVRSRRTYDRRSISIVDLSDDDESDVEWHTPPSQVVAPPFFSDDYNRSDGSSDEYEWKTAIASRRRSRRSVSRSAASRTKSRIARLSSERMRRSGEHRDAEFTPPSRQLRRSPCVLDDGLESPDTVPSTKVHDSEFSALGASAGSGRTGSGSRKVVRRRRASNERPLGRRRGPRRSVSAENLVDMEETSTPASSPIGTTRRHSSSRSYFASSRRDDVFGTSVRRNMPFVEIPDSDIEVIDVDPEVIDLCSDDDDSGHDGISPARGVDSERRRRVSLERTNMRTASFESNDEGEVSYGSSLILTGVTKYNPQPDSLPKPEREKYNRWLGMARKAEARGPEGYEAAIKLYTKCLNVCDGDDHLTNRILSLTSETGLLSNKDFCEGWITSVISKRARPLRRRLRRICSSDSSS